MPRRSPIPGWGFLLRPFRRPINPAVKNPVAGAQVAENWEKYCGWAVGIGLLIEVALAIEFRHGAGLVETWTPVFADALITAGVFGEIHFAGKISREEEAIRQQSEERVAEANARAEAAMLQAAEARERTAALERLTARRTIEPEKRSVLISELKELLAFRTAWVEWQTGDAEAWQLAREIAEVFRRAGCTEVGGMSNSLIARPIFGALVGTGDGLSTAPVLQAVNRAGVVASPMTIPASVLAHDANMAAYVFVGPKPPIDLEAHFAALSAKHAGGG
jgi:hypothetical protein